MGLFDKMKLYIEVVSYKHKLYSQRLQYVSITVLTFFSSSNNFSWISRITKELFIKLYATILNIIISKLESNTKIAQFFVLKVF